MPILVVCDSCGAKLSAPDAAAGKRVKCRKCQAVLTVPMPAPPEPEVEEDLELEEDAPAPPPVKRRRVEEDEEDDDRPRRKKRVVDEEEDDDEELPRKKGKQPTKKKGVNPMLFVVIGVAVLFVFGGVGFGVWYLALRESVEKPKASSNSPSRGLPGAGGTAGVAAGQTGNVPPPGWKKIETARYVVYIPVVGGAGTAEDRVPNDEDGVTNGAEGTLHNYLNPKHLIINVGEFTPETLAATKRNPKELLDKVKAVFEKDFFRKPKSGGMLPATVNGIDGYEWTNEDGKFRVSFRLFVVGERFYLLRMRNFDPPDVRNFFASFQAK